MAARRDNFTSHGRQYHPYRSQDKPPYNSGYDSRNRQYSADVHSSDVTRLFDTPSNSAGFSNNKREYPQDTYTLSRSNERGYPQDKYSQPHSNERGYPQDKYSQPHSNERGYPQDKYSQPHSNERGYAQDTHKQPHNQSFNIPSYNRGGMNTSMPGSSYPTNYTSYNRNDNHSMSQLSHFGPTEDLHKSYSSQAYLDNTGGFEELGNSSGNKNYCDGSDDDDDDNLSLSGLDLSKKEDLLKYIDKLLFAKQSEMLDAIDKYNEMVRKFDALGRVFVDPNDKRMYLHWRRYINKLSGVIKKDITFIPPNQFRLDQLLIDANQMPGLSNPGQSQNIRGFPNPNIDPNLKKGLKQHMQQRLFAKEKMNSESIALEKLRGNPELKLELFGENAKIHWEAKQKQKTNPKARFEARKALKRMRKKLKGMGSST